MSANAPKASLTSAIWNWGPYYEETIKQVNNGTWKSGAYWGSMKDKVVDIAPYGPAVSDETKKLADAAKADIIAGNKKFSPARCMIKAVPRKFLQALL